LTYAYFLIETDSGLTIAREYLYSNYESDKFDWVGRSGWEKLGFESLGPLVQVERYIEPVTDRSKELFLAQM
jgi:hypothetical protein